MFLQNIVCHVGSKVPNEAAEIHTYAENACQDKVYEEL